MFGDAAVAGDGFETFLDARVEVAERVERAEVVGLVLDDALVLLYGRGYLALGKVLLSRTDGFCLVESHREVLAARR